MAKTNLFTVTLDITGDGTNARPSRTDSSATAVDGGFHPQALANGNTVMTAPTGTTKGVWIWPSSTSTVAKYIAAANAATGIGATANWTTQMLFLPVLAGSSFSINANATENVDICWI